MRIPLMAEPQHCERGSITDEEDDQAESAENEQQAVRKTPPKSTVNKRVRVPEQYYCLSMDELRTYEGFLRKLLCSSLKRVGVCVLKDFLPSSLAELVHKETENLFSDSGGYGDSTKTQKSNPNFRSDEVAWVGSKDTKNTALNKLNCTLQNLVVSMGGLPELQQHRFKITHKSHIQVSKFPKGRAVGYKPHIENPNNNGRLLSVVYYTNKNYSKIEDEGLVRFYLKNNTRFIEVEPSFNTAVIHWSDQRVIKEVLSSNTRDLYHITSWFFGSCTLK